MHWGGNVTIEPEALARPAASLEIAELRSTKSGLVVDTRRFIARLRYRHLIRLRSAIKEAMDVGRPRLACAICATPVYLVATTQKAFFFRHRVEDGSCPAQTRDGLSEADIRAMKYKGAQESEAHRRLKSLIVRSLAADPAFSGVAVEASWRGARDPAALRRPDVRAMRDRLAIAFEAQLSTTFLDVVVGRKAFYRSEGALLVWVLPWFDPDDRRLTTDDVLFNNNSNIFVVDAASTAASEAAGRFLLRCSYRKPVLEAGVSVTRWETRLVSWDELSVDLVQQRLFAFDSEAADRAAQAALTAVTAARRDAADANLRQAALNLYVAAQLDPVASQLMVAWSELRERLVAQGFWLGVDASLGPDHRFGNIVCAMLSAQKGKPVGYRFEKLIQVAHHIADKYPAGIAPFALALAAADNGPLLEDQDRRGRWRDKKVRLREAYGNGDPSYFLEIDQRQLLAFLFPHISAKILKLKRPVAQITGALRW